MRLSLSYNTVTLRWADNSTAESGYVVQRAPNAWPYAWADIGALPANSTNHTDAGLARSTSYVYRVAGVRPDTGAPGVWSPTYGVTTGACAVDSVCDGPESCSPSSCSCAPDCRSPQAVAGDGLCSAVAGENCLNAPADCAGNPSGSGSDWFCW